LVSVLISFQRPVLTAETILIGRGNGTSFPAKRNVYA
jgi:hypothetical protein